jgi:hypothetical protein
MVNASPPASSPQLSRRSWTLLAMLGVVVIVIIGLVAWVAPSPQAGSTYSRSLTGYRSWYDTMLEQKKPIQRWQRNYDQLSGSDQTLIRIGGSSSSELGFSTADQDSLDNEETLQAWIKNGNTVIVLHWQGKVTTAPFTSRLSAGSDQVQIETTRRYTPQPASIPGLQRVSTAAQADAPPNLKAELRDSFGLVVWSRSIGDGTLISCTYPWLAANALVDQADNYRFLAMLAQRQPGPIWVDEWMHGHRDPPPKDGKDEEQKAELESQPQSFIDYLARTPVAVMIAQIGLISLLLVWGHNHRFGALVTLQPKVKDASEQYIQALASTMNAARKPDFVTQTLGQYFLQTLATQLGLTSAYGHNLPERDQIAAQWSAVTGLPAQDLLELLEPSVRSDRDLMAWIADLELLLREQP